MELLKIDCKGSEYEVLYSTEESKLRSIYAVRGEFRKFEESREDLNADRLLSFVRSFINNVKVNIWCQ